MLAGIAEALRQPYVAVHAPTGVAEVGAEANGHPRAHGAARVRRRPVGELAVAGRTERDRLGRGRPATRSPPWPVRSPRPSTPASRPVSSRSRGRGCSQSARRSARGCARTSTTVSAPRCPVSPSGSRRPAVPSQPSRARAGDPRRAPPRGGLAGDRGARDHRRPRARRRRPARLGARPGRGGRRAGACAWSSVTPRRRPAGPGRRGRRRQRIAGEALTNAVRHAGARADHGSP